ncbi:TPA: DUF3304 domain-containing protein [Burkholderia aenigmatica]|uniref:DUF3304 domain-containing protein n=1 Tax=Burkholderia sp. AU45251 TaxID=3059204 RepID=UPI00264DCE20|nr:DUF3304 domain-containing protein [Burkholderia sp. AU45251]HDR9481229.1 DUF3304 domain-containing protein [Burkholderia aenigmatica]MDN7514149.1 DUF3304 domain-containing protein [Burkholderia sp. AU45251]HDR9512755.1 DUF3304 domain-containing protein [Burkholderia aenigmatica]HDR9592946.1 DUF3304 domain-containing protein [Burkholderia aenigmatica]HDR9601072.1 DUF3304 domain-containing protein [Burkholderia aenigmatica]
MNVRTGSVIAVVRLAVFLAACVTGAGCSRATDHADPQAATAADEAGIGLKLNALNYTDVPIGTFYVDGTWGGNVAARIGSAGGGITCCVSVPEQWRPGLTVDVEWRNDEMFKRDPHALASRVVPIEPYGSFSDGYLWIVFFPGDRIKAYASPWLPGAPEFPEGLQVPSKACPGHFTVLNSSRDCPTPDKGMAGAVR